MRRALDSYSPNSGIALRRASALDQPRIVALVRAARINPMDLHWENFVVAVDEASGEIVGTGQVKPHRDGSRELASIAVVPQRQGRGIARAIVERLLSENHGTLYLTCSSGLVGLYAKFGFREIGEAEMPPYFRRLKQVAGTFELLSRGGTDLAVMKRE